MQETWRAMEILARTGRARNIGVSNLNVAGLRDLLAYARIPPAVLQVERHVYLQQPHLARFCADAGVALVGFSPLGAGSYVELGMAEPRDSPLLEPAVRAVASKHGVTPAQALLRFGIQRPPSLVSSSSSSSPTAAGGALSAAGGHRLGAAVIPKTSNATRLAENLDLFRFALDSQDMVALAKLDRNRRFNDPGEFTQGMNSFFAIFD
mmetsp:Transcript_24096/g.54383  ORF Transcript_24096/g.54383 Transcript_24096/m.54383 type:complete len:208 (-) Transcript_24096:226-849(-)